MRQKTINKIIENHCLGQHTYIGRSVYNLARDPETNRCYVIRCKRGDEYKEWDAWERFCEIEIDF